MAALEAQGGDVIRRSMRIPPSMMNFFFGSVAGGTIACVVTITAARHPEVQSRLGLVPTVHAALAAPPSIRGDNRCQAAAKADVAHAADEADMLFAPRRFWFVAPK